jgi:hypothetical protein
MSASTACRLRLSHPARAAALRLIIGRTSRLRPIQGAARPAPVLRAKLARFSRQFKPFLPFQGSPSLLPACYLPATSLRPACHPPATSLLPTGLTHLLTYSHTPTCLSPAHVDHFPHPAYNPSCNTKPTTRGEETRTRTTRAPKGQTARSSHSRRETLRYQGPRWWHPLKRRGPGALRPARPHRRGKAHPRRNSQGPNRGRCALFSAPRPFWLHRRPLP